MGEGAGLATGDSNAPALAVDEVYFQPPLAIGRVGPGHAPMPNFKWSTDRTIHGGHRTTLEPDVTLTVQPDGSLRTYLPNVIQFQDEGGLRPVAPFFELWVRYREGDEQHDVPLTSELLGRLGASLGSVRYDVTAANRKAQRRTLSAACAIVGRVAVAGDDHGRRALMAYSPHNPGETPLVARDRPIPFGDLQVIRPVQGVSQGVNLDVLRIRFTPARGEVYGPPDAISSPASPLPPGGALPAGTLGGRQHEIVPEPNRILNPGTPWSGYVMDVKGQQQDPQPSDSYDGANVGENRSWGVVDDTCDGVIEAQVVIGMRRFVAHARFFSSCPDYGPDRRPFYSLADDLADRDEGDVPPPESWTDAEFHTYLEEVADLFRRAFEVASLVNLDATRQHGILENSDLVGKVGNPPGMPKVDNKTMTPADQPYASDRITAEVTRSVPHAPTPYADLAKTAHARLADMETLFDFIAGNEARLRQILRPPFARLAELPVTPAPPSPASVFRDPRAPRDTMQDMRMPPYMRDSDENPLSLTHRQYHLILGVARYLAAHPHETPAHRRVRAHAAPLKQHADAGAATR